MEFVQLPKSLVQELFVVWKRVQETVTPTVSADLKKVLTEVQDTISQLERQTVGNEAIACSFSNSSSY